VAQVHQQEQQRQQRQQQQQITAEYSSGWRLSADASSGLTVSVVDVRKMVISRSSSSGEDRRALEEVVIKSRSPP